MAITVTNKNFSHIIFDSEKPVLLNFSNRQSDASRKQDNLLRLVAHEHPDVIIGRVDTGKEPSLAAMYGIQTVPSIKIFKNGKCTATAAGLQEKPQLARLLSK